VVILKSNIDQPNGNPTLNFTATKQFDYVWSSINNAQSKNIPSFIWPWLAEQGSLTAKIQTLGKLTVDVISDTWGPTTQRERKKLKLRPREAARIREVILNVDGQAIIYARSIIPARSLKGHWRYLPKLGNQPLGGFLYKHKGLTRGGIEVSQLPPSLFSHINEPTWARRSVFYQYGQGILVNEVFFPAIKPFLNIKEKQCVK